MTPLLPLALLFAAGPVPQSADPPATPAGVPAAIECADGSTLRVKLLDDKLELVTKYGVLRIDAADVEMIEFAHRCPPDVAEKIAVAISKLGHADYQAREQATAELKGYRERAYPYLLRVTKSDDPEVGKRAADAAKWIAAAVPHSLLQARDDDVVRAAGGKFAGKLTAGSLRVLTGVFGEQSLKVCDCRVLRTGAAGEPAAKAPDAPVTLTSYQNRPGLELAFSVTGYAPGNGQQPPVWGDGVYTLDSNLAAAAVHAGAAEPGKAAVVRVRVLPSPDRYAAGARNGVTSAAYGAYPAGAFEFVKDGGP